MTGERKKLEIPKGVDDFKELRDEGYYFVDKSELISDILQNRNKVFLFTRPRRFGKSLNLSMLDAFFNIKYKGNNWFDGLKISDHPEVEEYRNAYPVIRLSMNELSYHSYDQFLSDFSDLVRDLYDKYNYLADSDKLTALQHTYYQDVLSGTANITILKKSLLRLCSMLKQYHGTKPIILIDEYDATLNYAYGRETYDGILEVLRSFYSLALKGNESLKFAIVTGVMQIAKEGIFSGLNNLDVNNIFGTRFDERYGFTEPEVKELCTYYGHPEKFDEVKEWYDGYRFGDAEIYNPWSVMSCILEKFSTGAYWAGTSGNSIIDTLLENSNEKTFKDLHALSNGETVLKPLVPTVAMNDLKVEPSAVFSVFTVSGYLKAIPAKQDYLLSIPNREMYSAFYKHLKKFLFHGGSDPFAPFLDALEAGNTAKIKGTLDSFFQNFSFFLLKEEGYYHAILAVMILSREGKYTILIDRETGDGRHDIFMKSRFPRYPNIVVEIKKADSEASDATVQHLAQKALDQIHEKDYCRGLEGKTFLYGIAFKAKTATVLFEETVI